MFAHVVTAPGCHVSLCLNSKFLVAGWRLLPQRLTLLVLTLSLWQRQPNTTDIPATWPHRSVRPLLEATPTASATPHTNHTPHCFLIACCTHTHYVPLHMATAVAYVFLAPEDLVHVQTDWLDMLRAA